MKNHNTKLVVHVNTQTAELFLGNKLFKTYKVSTAAKGLGCQKGSYKTPLGEFKVSEKFGSGAPLGTIFKSRLPTGEIWSASEQKYDPDEDLILTRILWLEGCEPHNANTKDRYIYIHGTNQEICLGTPASHGCIRMSNKDIIEAFGLIPEKTTVIISP